jgi:uncharacterized sulfatase
MMTRRTFLNVTAGSAVAAGALTRCATAGDESSPKRPNILFAIADDQSWAHTSILGDKVVKTPTFDRIAGEGVLFNHAYCSAPSCTPSRGAVLTGQDFWRLEEGANLWSTLPVKFASYPELLQDAGYAIGCTRKGWGPGKEEPGDRTVNPAGPHYRSFKAFLDEKPDGKPFCFWFGSHEPHRPYKEGSGVASGKQIEDVEVPPFLPDAPEVRSDILDYYVEVEKYDRDVGELLALLEERGELDNTLVVMTSDNGMPWPRAKTNLYDFGTRMPLAVCWPGMIPAGRVVDDFISFADFAPTFLEAAGLEPLPGMTGRSFLDVLTSTEDGRVDPKRDRAHFGRERHTFVTDDGIGYPCRAVRTHDFLYIRNFMPDRWPAGPAPIYRDIDGGPTKSYLLAHKDEEVVRPCFELATGKRPAEELYDVRKDPYQLENVAEDTAYTEELNRLREELEAYLRETKDPRVVGGAEAFYGYAYYGNKDAK